MNLVLRAAEWADQSIPEEFDGISLLQTAANRFYQDRRSVLTTMLGSCSLRRRDMRLNLYPDGSIELYHMLIDSNQRNNLAELSQWQRVVESMKRSIVQEIMQQGGIMDADSKRDRPSGSQFVRTRVVVHYRWKTGSN